MPTTRTGCARSWSISIPMWPTRFVSTRGNTVQHLAARQLRRNHYPLPFTAHKYVGRAQRRPALFANQTSHEDGGVAVHSHGGVFQRELGQTVRTAGIRHEFTF